MSAKPLLIRDFSSLSLHALTDIAALTDIFNVGNSVGILKESWLTAVLAREATSPTGLPTAVPVAIPHTDAQHCDADGIGFFRLTQPVSFGEMGSLDRKVEVQLIIPLLITDSKAQLPLLMSVINLVQDSEKLNALMTLQTESEIAEFFAKNLTQTLGL
jgi:PTS system galactitol-specific IIA component